MTSDQNAIEDCAALCGLDFSEFMVDATPSARHGSLHASYVLLRKLGWTTLRDMIVADIRAALDLGASKRTTDLVIVLRMLLFGHPESTIAQQCRTPFCGAAPPSHGESTGASMSSMKTLKAEHAL